MARIVFDLDGTLIDSAPDIHGIANKVLQARGDAPITIEDTRRFIGNGASVFVDHMRAARDIDASEHGAMLEMFMAEYEDAVHLTVPYDGVIEVLEGFLAEGHSLGVCTNKPIAPTRRVLDHLNLSPYFSAVFGGDSLPVRKPDPAPLRAAFDALPHGPEIYVGDSDVDAQTGQALGVPFLLFTQGYRRSPVEALPHTGAFDHWAQVPDLVSQLSRSMT